MMKLRRWIGIGLVIASIALPAESFAATQHRTRHVTQHHVTKHHVTKHRTRHHRRHHANYVTGVLYSALVVDADSGRVLYSKNANGVRYPASLTKMMTLYLTFEALKRDKLDLDDRLPVSEKAASMPQTNIGLDAGDRLPVESAIESIVVRSANDSAVVLAEALGGTTWNFALMMNQKARELGMVHTVFRNPNGLPDNAQHTTAFDMARLAIALRRDFPEYYHFFKMTSFTYNGITYPGHNHVMERYAGADGVKTGYIHASGYNLVTSVQKHGRRIVAVIMGGHSVRSRDNQMISMLNHTFTQLAREKGKDDEDKNANSSVTLDNAEQLLAAGHG